MENKKPVSPLVLDRWDLEKRFPESMVSKYPGLMMKEFDKRVVVIGRDNDRDQIDFEIKLLKEAAQREKELEAAKRRQEQAEQEAAK